MKGAQLGRIIRLLEEGELRAEARQRWIDGLFLSVEEAQDPQIVEEHMQMPGEEKRRRFQLRTWKFIR
jgi:hypothetical protein